MCARRRRESSAWCASALNQPSSAQSALISPISPGGSRRVGATSARGTRTDWWRERSRVLRSRDRSRVLRSRERSRALSPPTDRLHSGHERGHVPSAR
eukprot:6202779-Prymnesium_polylepis.1